jgi:O-acetyl-ADP-ribose deacetylase (regulator of RNase III)
MLLHTGKTPRVTDMTTQVEVVEADITTLSVDAIVNAANERMLGGGGVDGAIHRAAGPQLLEECRRVPEVRPGMRCPTGEARITAGYRLPARHVIHTVGPVWDGGGYNEDKLLASCYRSALDLGMQQNLKSIAFPAISTGIYGFPLDRAAKIAVREVKRFIGEHPGVYERIVLVCFGPDALDAFKGALR